MTHLHRSQSTHITIPEDWEPDRADRILTLCVEEEISRSAMARMIRDGRVLMDGRPLRPSSEVRGGDWVVIMAAGEQVSADGFTPVPEFRIIEEDEHILVVDKPPGLVVHPGAGRASGTLMDAVLETRPEIEGVGEPGRWGVVHRLDRDTSGVMVMAKTPWAHRELSARFKAHAIHRVYLALVRGTPRVDGGLIDAAVGRHPKDRKRMSTTTDKPRTAVTEWRVLERLDRVSLLEILPQTGRTHQIRVHLASIGLPVAGDRVYGKARSAKGNPDSGTPAALKGLSRQALHAAVLGFDHPGAGEAVEFRSPLPDDLAECLARCRSG